MAFHGFTKPVNDNITGELLLVRKNNSIALMMHKPFQPHILSRVQRMIAFGNVKHQIFKELFLNKVNFFVKYHSNSKKISNGTCSWLILLFNNW
jgi:hypothetical protein